MKASHQNFLLALSLFLLPGRAYPQQETPDLSAPARTWAVDAAKNEVLVVDHPGSYVRYRMHEVNERGDRVRDQIESKDGTVARLILRDGHPIGPEEDAAERDRLKAQLASPSTFYRHVRNDQETKKSYSELLKQMPDAMLWSYAPNQPQLPNLQPATGNPQLPLVVLDFTPNPKWSPPSLASEALTGIKGRIWVDSRSRRVVRVEAELFRAVNIGWGFLAHIYPPGNAVLQQTDAGNQRWIVEHVDEQVNLRAMLVKTIRSHLVEDTSDLQTVNPMTYQQAIEILLNTPLPSQ
jgi:hypothetical protein